MKIHSRHAFTLIEMLTVMIIIAILASLIMATAGYVNRTAAAKRADAEIHALSLACEAFRADNGAYPSSKDTDKLDPKTDGSPKGTNPSGSKYEDASFQLYADLSTDKDGDGRPDGKPYYEGGFKPDQLGGEKTAGKITKVKYLQDPFGNSYGYSTAGARAEEEFQTDARKNKNATRPNPLPGFNQTKFDLWSTAGVVTSTTLTDENRKKWIKNW